MEEVGRWLRLPGIGEPEILGVVGEMMAGKRDGPPSTLRYFRPGIERLAAAKAAPPIDPSTLPVVRRGKAHGPSDRVQFDIAHREFTRRLAAGEIQRGPDPSDPWAEQPAAAKAALPIEPSTHPVVRRGKAHGPSDRIKGDIAVRELARRVGSGEIDIRFDEGNPFAVG
ncbi:hypothetical protein ACN9JG_04090 [Cereibacter azotoformans]|uniref:hypothetical protein n=1 Tax=Cereibacter azotoformans TaxID=43057 RepID=UPI003B217462